MFWRAAREYRDLFGKYANLVYDDANCLWTADKLLFRGGTEHIALTKETRAGRVDYLLHFTLDCFRFISLFVYFGFILFVLIFFKTLLQEIIVDFDVAMLKHFHIGSVFALSFEQDTVASNLCPHAFVYEREWNRFYNLLLMKISL